MSDDMDSGMFGFVLSYIKVLFNVMPLRTTAQLQCALEEKKLEIKELQAIIDKLKV
jgi:hypothetical protein